MVASQKRDKVRLRGLRKSMQRLEHVCEKVLVPGAQLTHFSTLAEEKNMLLILNLIALASVTNISPTKPLARLNSKMMSTQPESAHVSHHTAVQLLEQIQRGLERRTP